MGGHSPTHDEIVNHERKKYGEDWLTFTEISYGGYIFDLIAVNLKTKEVEFLEVDFTHNTSKDKIEFAEKLGKVKIFRPLGEKVTTKDYQRIIDALGDPKRMAILEALFDKGNLSYSEIARMLKYNPRYDAGLFGYHMKLLTKNKLVFKNQQGKYENSEKGKRIITFFRDLDSGI